MDWNDLKRFIGVKNNDSDSVLKACFDDAVALLDMALLEAFRPAPINIRNRMNILVANELWNQKNAPSAQGQYTQFDGTAIPVRISRDPLYPVRSMLAMFVVPF